MEKKRILVVDDEAAVTLALEGFFQKQGYQVLKAFYGDQALKYIKQEPPSVLILDLQMPGMDGIAILEKVRLAYPEVKTLVVTAHLERYQKELDRLKPDLVKTKPISLDELTQAVKILIEGKKSAGTSKATETVTQIRILFVEGSVELFEKVVRPFFEDPARSLPYKLALACELEETFRLLEEFKPHLAVLDSTRLPVGIDSGELAADLGSAPHGPMEVILQSFPSSWLREKGSPTESLRRLEETIQQAAKRHALISN